MEISNTLSNPISSIDKILKRLLERTGGLSGSELARRLKLPSPTINRILSRQVTDPRSSTLLLIANYFEITVDQLLGTEPLPDKFAQETLDSEIRPSMTIPLLTAAEAADYSRYFNSPSHWFRWSTRQANKNHHVFAMTVQSATLEPLFTEGTILIIDPNVESDSGDYVAVNLKNEQSVTIRKYIREGGSQYLYPLQHGLKIIALDDIEYKMCGVVLEAHMNLKK